LSLYSVEGAVDDVATLHRNELPEYDEADVAEEFEYCESRESEPRMATERANVLGLDGVCEPFDEFEYVDWRAKEVKVRFERALGGEA
jgi:hypothetical protein